MAPGVGFEPTWPQRATGSQGPRHGPQICVSGLGYPGFLNVLAGNISKIFLKFKLKTEGILIGMTYRFLEHTSDAYVEAEGDTLEEAFVEAARGMFDVITDPSTIEICVKRDITVEAEDLESLLYSWLEELLLLFDIEGLVINDFSIIIEKRSGGYILQGEVRGESFNPSKHPPETDVKAVTYHGMSIKKTNNKYVVRVLFDI